MDSTSFVWRSSWLVVGALLLTGCGRQPSAVSNQQSAVSDQQPVVEGILADQRKVFESEDEIIRFVKADTNRWAQHQFGWWYRYVHTSDQHIEYELIAPAKDTCVVIHERVCTLDGRLIVDAIREFDLGGKFSEKDEPFAYELMMRELVNEDTIVMLVPWVAGYGKEGKGFVPPETNLCVELTIEDRPFH